MQHNRSRWRWLVALLVGVLLYYLARFIALLLTRAISGVDEMKGLSLSLLGVLGMLLVTGAISLAIRLANRRLEDLGLTTANWRTDVVIGIAIGIAWPLLEFLVLIPNTGGVTRSDVVASRALIGNTIWGLLGTTIAGWALGGFSEELFFRAHLIYNLRHLLGNSRLAVGVAILVSALFFGWGHAYQGLIGQIDTGAFGLVMALLYIWRGRLTASIVAHGLNDTLLLVGLYLFY